MKKCARPKDNIGRRIEVKTDPLEYASTRAAHQDVSLKGAAEEYMAPQPKTMGPHDQLSQYEIMQMSDHPIYSNLLL